MQRFRTKRCSSYWGAKIFLHVHNNQSGLIVLDFGDCHNLVNQYGTPYHYCKVSSRFLDRPERNWKDRWEKWGLSQTEDHPSNLHKFDVVSEVRLTGITIADSGISPIFAAPLTKNFRYLTDILERLICIWFTKIFCIESISYLVSNI